MTPPRPLASIRWLQAVQRCRCVGATSLVVALVVATHRPAHGPAELSLTQIARYGRLARSTVARDTAELVRLGFVAREKRTGPHGSRSSLYLPTTPEGACLAAHDEGCPTRGGSPAAGRGSARSTQGGSPPGGLGGSTTWTPQGVHQVDPYYKGEGKNAPRAGRGRAGRRAPGPDTGPPAAARVAAEQGPPARPGQGQGSSSDNTPAPARAGALRHAGSRDPGAVTR